MYWQSPVIFQGRLGRYLGETIDQGIDSYAIWLGTNEDYSRFKNGYLA